MKFISRYLLLIFIVESWNLYLLILWVEKTFVSHKAGDNVGRKNYIIFILECIIIYIYVYNILYYFNQDVNRLCFRLNILSISSDTLLRWETTINKALRVKNWMSLEKQWYNYLFLRDFTLWSEIHSKNYREQKYM